MRIYLAGSFSNWREQIKQEVPQHTYLDPSEHHHLSRRTSTPISTWSRYACQTWCWHASTRRTPATTALPWRSGTRLALGIPVILIDELTPNKDPRAKYFGMARSVAQATVSTTTEAIDLLKALPR